METPVPIRPLPAGRKAARRRARGVQDNLEGYAFAAPFLVAYGLFLIYPFFKGIWISLHDWNLLAVAFDPAAKKFVGLENYIHMVWGRHLVWGVDHLVWARLLGLAAVAAAVAFASSGRLRWRTAILFAVIGVLLFGVALGIHPASDGRWFDRRFWHIVWNTLLFVLLTVPAVTVIALGLAIALNRQSRHAAALRTAFFLSQVLSVTVVTLIWQFMFSPKQGILANVMTALGMRPIEWITNTSLAMPAIVITTVWWSIGFAMIIYLAGLQEIPDELYEAARIDGAGGWTILRNITLPALSRTTTLVVVLQIILQFQVFGQSHLITRGGPNDSTQVLVRYIYQTAFQNSQLGYASALSVFLFIFMLGFSLLQARVQGAD